MCSLQPRVCPSGYCQGSGHSHQLCILLLILICSLLCHALVQPTSCAGKLTGQHPQNHHHHRRRHPLVLMMAEVGQAWREAEGQGVAVLQGVQLGVLKRLPAVVETVASLQ